MDHQVPDIDQQIASFLSGNCNSAEVEAVKQWKNHSEENKKSFEEAVKVWENTPDPLSAAEVEHDKITVKNTIITQTSLQLNRNRVLLKYLRIAAAFMGPVMLAIGWYIGINHHPKEALTWNSVTAPRKHISICTMGDGTEVWLNAGSTLSYPATDLSDKREVKLSGEGYFKVAKDDRKPFYVITPNATVRVLGTTFNVKAYPEEELLTTTLEEGSIELSAPKAGSAPYKLQPGEQAIFQVNEGKIEISQVDAPRFSAWRSEKFLFKDADLKTIITELERLYDIKIHIQNPKLEKLRFRGMFSYDQDLLDAFETLRRSVRLTYTIKDREVWLE